MNTCTKNYKKEIRMRNQFKRDLSREKISARTFSHGFARIVFNDGISTFFSTPYTMTSQRSNREWRHATLVSLVQRQRCPHLPPHAPPMANNHTFSNSPPISQGMNLRMGNPSIVKTPHIALHFVTSTYTLVQHTANIRKGLKREDSFLGISHKVRQRIWQAFKTVTRYENYRKVSK